MSKKFLLSLIIIMSTTSCGYSYNNTQPYYYQKTDQVVSKNICTCKDNNSSNNSKENNNKIKDNNKNKVENNNNTIENINNNNNLDKNNQIKNSNKNEKLIQTILKNMVKADENNKVYEATFTNYSKGRMKNGKDTGQIREVTIKARMTLKKPRNVKMYVIESPEPMARGATLLYTGGNKVKVKASGVLGLIPVSFDVNDPMFENARGHTIMSSFDGIRRLLLKDTKIEILGTSYIGDKKVYLLKVIPAEKLDNEITHEVYSVDINTFIVLSVEMFVNKDLVFQYKIDDIKTNINISDDFFTL